MAYDFKSEDKEVREYSESLPFGISEVQIMQAETGTSEKGSDFIELTVTDKDGIEDKARFWFTGGAVQISFNNIRQIAVHCAKDEEEKAAAREAIDSASNSDDLASYLNEKCIGGQVWFTKYYDPERTYTTGKGTFRSINKNVIGYQPKLKPELMPQKVRQGGDATAPASEADSLAADIPKDWAA
jgi:hypothetical protein